MRNLPAVIFFGVSCRSVSCLELIWPLLSPLKVHLRLEAVLQACRDGEEQMEKLQLQDAAQVEPAGFLG